MLPPESTEQKRSRALQILRWLVGTIAVGAGVGALVAFGVFRDPATLKTSIDNLRDLAFSLTEFIAVALLLSFIGILIGWMSSEDKAITVLPFDNATGITAFSGVAISESLMSEIIRIRQTLSKKREGIESENLKKRPLNARGEGMESSLSNLGTIAMGETKLSIGWLLVVLRQWWPRGDPGSVITGSLQRFGNIFRLVARREHPTNVLAWEVSRRLKSRSQIPDLIRDLAFQIVRDLDDETIAARTWQGLKHFNAALDAYDQFLQTEQDSDLDRAIHDCYQAIAAEPGYAPPYHVLGTIFFNQDDYAKAEEMFRQATAISFGYERDPEAFNRRAEAFVGLGNVYLNLGRYDDAIMAYRRALRYHARYANAYDGLGDVYVEQEKYDEAIAAYQSAIKFDPNYDLSLIGLGWIYLQKKKWAQAERELRKAIALDPDYYVPVFMLGLAQAFEGRAGDAQGSWQEALTLCDGDLVAQRLDRALYSIALGNPERAVKELDRILKEKPPAETLRDWLEDAELIAQTPIKPAGIDDAIKMVRENIPPTAA